MMANHVVGKPPPSHFRAVLSLTGKVPLTGFDWPVERRVNDVVDYVNGSRSYKYIFCGNSFTCVTDWS